jgi:hypothetical protein
MEVCGIIGPGETAFKNVVENISSLSRFNDGRWSHISRETSVWTLL